MTQKGWGSKEFAEAIARSCKYGFKFARLSSHLVEFGIVEKRHIKVSNLSELRILVPRSWRSRHKPPEVRAVPEVELADRGNYSPSSGSPDDSVNEVAKRPRHAV